MKNDDSSTLSNPVFTDVSFFASCDSWLDLKDYKEWTAKGEINDDFRIKGKCPKFLYDPEKT